MDSLEQEVKDLKLELIHTQMELSEIKAKYDSLCGKMRTNANDKRNNEGEHFLRNYGNSGIARSWK